MIKTKKVTDLFGMPVYTDDGFFYGEIEESIISGNKIHSWKVKATKNSQLSSVLSGAKGAIIQHQLVKSVGDIMIISKTALPIVEESKEEL